MARESRNPLNARYFLKKREKKIKGHKNTSTKSIEWNRKGRIGNL